MPLELETVRRCMDIKERYGYSWWDSLVLASALDSGCTVLYSEDMQSRQVVEGSLRIVNPFAE